MSLWFALALAWGQVPDPVDLPLADELAVPAISAPEGDDAQLPAEPTPAAPEPQPVTFEVPPVEGAETLVILHDPFGRPQRGATVQVLHRPGLHGERTEAIGITDSRGRVRWTPTQGGLAIVRAGDEERVVSVGWARTRPETASLLALLGLAGLLMSGYGLLPPRRRKKPV